MTNLILAIIFILALIAYSILMVNCTLFGTVLTILVFIAVFVPKEITNKIWNKLKELSSIILKFIFAIIEFVIDEII